jgi:pSer/pThr/pTyr-binding forkhead associated (FHA) protein
MNYINSNTETAYTQSKRNESAFVNSDNKNGVKNCIILKVINGPQKNTEFIIQLLTTFQKITRRKNKIDGSFTLGRDALGSEASFRMENQSDRYISRNHCIIELENKGKTIYLIDNNSLNGTWLFRKGFTNFVKVTNRMKLHYDDTILIGRTTLRVVKKSKMK